MNAVWIPGAPRAAISAPYSATPIPPPACRTVLRTPAATPERDPGTVESSADVINGTAKPMPAGITIRPGSIAA